MISIKKLVQVQKHLQRNLQCNRIFSTTAIVEFKRRRLPYYRSVDEVLRWKWQYQIYPHKMFYKLLYRTKKENPFFVKPPVGAPSISYEDAVISSASGREAESKRVRRFNKLFMRYIPEMMTTSEFGSYLCQYGVQISDIKIAQNLKVIDVYWIPTGDGKKDEKVQHILDKIAYPLRRELTATKVMGLIPPIVFKKDTKYAYLQLLDKLMATADYGDNYVKSYVDENQMRKDLQLEISIPQGLKSKITKLETNETFTEVEERTIPPMRVNVFGLDHNIIMNRILECKKHRVFEKDSSKDVENIIDNYAIKKMYLKAEPIENWDRFAFREFIKKRKIDRKRMMKVAQRELADLERELAMMSFIEEPTLDEQLYQEFVMHSYPDIVDLDFKDEFNVDQLSAQKL